MPQTPKQLLGQRSENLAKQILLKRGYKIIETNFRTKFGEIDIIALDEDTLVFVEVKARTGKKMGYPEEAVNKHKVRRIKMASHIYNQKNPHRFKKFRIDIVSILTDTSEFKIIKGVDL